MPSSSSARAPAGRPTSSACARCAVATSVRAAVRRPHCPCGRRGARPRERAQPPPERCGPGANLSVGDARTDHLPRRRAHWIEESSCTGDELTRAIDAVWTSSTPGAAGRREFGPEKRGLRARRGCHCRVGRWATRSSSRSSGRSVTDGPRHQPDVAHSGGGATGADRQHLLPTAHHRSWRPRHSRIRRRWAGDRRYRAHGAGRRWRTMFSRGASVRASSCHPTGPTGGARGGDCRRGTMRAWSFCRRVTARSSCSRSTAFPAGKAAAGHGCRRLRGDRRAPG